MINHMEGNIFDGKEDILIHQVNYFGVMGGGVARQLKELYPHVFEVYKKTCEEALYDPKALLGSVLFVDAENGKQIANIFGQGEPDRTGCYTNYDALKEALIYINKVCKGKTIAAPYKMSCGLAGGDWYIVSKMLEEYLCDCEVTLYEYVG